MFVLANMWFQTLMRQFFFNIDKIVFNFISTIYDFLITIARTSVLSQADIIDVANRVYKLLAVFMIFKVTFSLIMYVVNPDDFSDKNKGVGKLGTNIVISLALLILTPYIFNYAYQLQTIILEDNSLATLIFGEETCDDEDSFASAGDKMAFITMSPFFVPNAALDELNECAQLTVSKTETTSCGTKNVQRVNEACSGLDEDYNPTGTDSERAQSLYALTKDEDDKENTRFTEQTLKNYVAGVNMGNLGLMFRSDMAIATNPDNTEYIMDYKYIFSTVVGVVVILLLVTFCMDVALRSIKLAFLQLVAPIPIISYVDPKSGKDGMFKKWYTMCFKTYISLFIRLLAIYFAAYIISKIDKMVDIIDGSYVSNLLVKIFIIIGALMFAKQLPKILEGLGIKLDGDGKFFLNPIKKFEEQAAGGKRITGAAGALTAGIADRAARIATAPGGKEKLKAALGAGPGLLGSAARGFNSNAGFKGGLDKQAAVNRRLREGRINGLSPMSSYLDYAGSKFGLDDATSEKESTLIRRTEDSIRQAETNLATQTLANTLAIENEKKVQTTRKNTKSDYDNVKKQGDRVLKTAEDFLVKKGNFDRGATNKARLDHLDKTINNAKAAGLTTLQYTDKKDGTVSNLSLEEYEARERRDINSRNYKMNRNADEANVQYLSDHNGETLTSSFMIGNQYFAAGTTIDGNLIAQAKEAQGGYIKDSQKAVTNEMYRMSQEPSKLTDEEQKFYEKYESDFSAFTNVNKEFRESVRKANQSVGAYNNEYDEKIATIDESVLKASSTDDVYSMTKSIIGEMESGRSITSINTELSKSEEKVQRWERENDDARRNTYATYYDENGKKESKQLDEAKSRIKTRDENNKHRIKQREQRRALMQNLSNKK